MPMRLKVFAASSSSHFDSLTSTSLFSPRDHRPGMSFRKRNVVILPEGRARPSPPSSSSPDSKAALTIPGVRPSPLDGRPTTSTGTRSLDALLVGHAGLALGNSILVEESGTTEFGGALLRYYAAEGVVQGHQVHVFGMNDAWGRDLPGLAGTKEKGAAKREMKDSGDKMKIAWRYERLGEFGAGARGAGSRFVHTTPRFMPNVPGNDHPGSCDDPDQF